MLMTGVGRQQVYPVASRPTAVSLKLQLILAGRQAGMQRKEPLTSAGFQAAQFHESWSRSAAVGVGQQPTQS
jgi:hypothetical protein